MPPDQALAASSSWVLEGINSAFAVYSSNGKLQPGWPKSVSSFFGVPDPRPAGCAPGPFMSDPRAFYDPSDHRFWAIALEVEGIHAGEEQVNASCAFASRYYVAVSKTSDPRGGWFVYTFNVGIGNREWADFTPFGFDSRAVYFSADLVDTASGQITCGEVFEANKARMEAGSRSFRALGFRHLCIGGRPLEAIHPAASQGPVVPGAEFFVSSFGAGGAGCQRFACRGLVVYALSNPIAHDSGGPRPVLSHVVVSGARYSLPPNADEPGCRGCIDSGRTTVSARPVAFGGNVWGALTTGVTSGTKKVVPGLFVFALHPSLSSGTRACPACRTIVRAALGQHAYLGFSGGLGALYPAMGVDGSGNVFTVFDVMGARLNPSIAVVVHRRAAPSGSFSQPSSVVTGPTPAKVLPLGRWGDFSATSFDGIRGDPVWVAGETTGPAGRAATYLARATVGR